MKFDRVAVDPAICGGKPCTRGLRFPVSRLLSLLAAGETRESVLHNYPYLEAADINEALRYAAFVVDDETVKHARRAVHLPVSTATGGLMPDVDLTRFSDYQEMEDLEYIERMKRFK
jgi:uncharacterized protein (DUF433 family)